MPPHPKTPSSLASFKSRLVLLFWYRLTQVVLEKRPLNWCSSSSRLMDWLNVAEAGCSEQDRLVPTSEEESIWLAGTVLEYQIYVGWQFCSIVPCLCQLVFAVMWWGQIMRNVCCCGIALLVRWCHMDIFLNQLIQFVLNNAINLCHVTSRIMSCLPTAWRLYCDRNDVTAPCVYAGYCLPMSAFAECVRQYCVWIAKAE